MHFFNSLLLLLKTAIILRVILFDKASSIYLYVVTVICKKSKIILAF